jgi:hypothetical protein
LDIVVLAAGKEYERNTCPVMLIEAIKYDCAFLRSKYVLREKKQAKLMSLVWWEEITGNTKYVSHFDRI